MNRRQLIRQLTDAEEDVENLRWDSRGHLGSGN